MFGVQLIIGSGEAISRLPEPLLFKAMGPCIEEVIDFLAGRRAIGTAPDSRGARPGITARYNRQTLGAGSSVGGDRSQPRHGQARVRNRWRSIFYTDPANAAIHAMGLE